MSEQHHDDYDADTLTGIVEDELSQRMSLGTSGRYLVDYGLTPSDLAHLIVTRVIPPAECSTCGGRGSIPWMVESDPNAYQEPDADGRVPCPDCVTSPAEGHGGQP